jgi:hypothetical protein
LTIDRTRKERRYFWFFRQDTAEMLRFDSQKGDLESVKLHLNNGYLLAYVLADGEDMVMMLSKPLGEDELPIKRQPDVYFYLKEGDIPDAVFDCVPPTNEM